MNNHDFTEKEKRDRLLERLLAEHEQAQQFTSQALGRQNEICEVNVSVMHAGRSSTVHWV